MTIKNKLSRFSPAKWFFQTIEKLFNRKIVRDEKRFQQNTLNSSTQQYKSFYSQAVKLVAKYEPRALNDWATSNFQFTELQLSF